MTEFRFHIQRFILPAANISLRGLSLVARFALTLFMAKYLTLAEIGVFGLFYSATAAAPAFLGFGMNFFLNRQIVRIPFDEALRRLRDRVAVSIIVVTVVAFLISLLLNFCDVCSIAHHRLFCLILILEVVALDIHYSLISLKRPLLANFLLFIRSALWVFPFVGVAFFFPQYRSLGAVLYFWFAAACISFLVLGWCVRNWPWSSMKNVRFDATWFRIVLTKSKLIYASDIGIVGTMFADRYILGSLGGIEAVGLFVFFWTIANSVQVLVSTAVSQIAMPHMVDAHAEGGGAALRILLKRKSLEAALIGIVLGAFAIVAIYFVVPFLGHHEFGQNIHLLVILLVAAILRSVSDVWNVALYSAGCDTHWAWINIFGAIALSVASLTGLYLGGISGLAFASVIVAAAQWCARVYFMERQK